MGITHGEEMAGNHEWARMHTNEDVSEPSRLGFSALFCFRSGRRSHRVYRNLNRSFFLPHHQQHRTSDGKTREAQPRPLQAEDHFEEPVESSKLEVMRGLRFVLAARAQIFPFTRRPNQRQE